MNTSKNVRSRLLIILLFITAIMILSLLFSQGKSLYADSNENKFEKNTTNEYVVFGKSSIQENFADDKILVVLNRQETLRFKNWDIDDFPEIDIISVENLTATSENVVNADLTRRKYGETYQTKNVKHVSKSKINAEEFKTILCLTLKNSGKENVLNAIERLRHRTDIITAEPDYAFTFTSTPNDTYFVEGKQWGLNGEKGINAPQAWNMVKGSNSVMVGVIDSGIQANHPDLQGRVNICLSRDFTLPAPYIPESVTDTNGHGTHCAGIIGAQGNNSMGITGVGQNIQLVSLKISQVAGTPAAENTFASHVVSAINYAATENIPILSCSNGTQNFLGSTASLTAFETAVTNYTGLYINAAGNNSRNNDNNPDGFPRAQFHPDNFLSVGSLDSNGNLSSFSNWGVNTVDIYAPGGNILSTWPTELTNQHDSGRPGYRTMSGTSMATPHVAGVAALMLSANPDLTPQELKTIIKESANIVSLTTPSSTTINGRCLNAETAVGEVSTFTVEEISSNTVKLTGIALGKQLTDSILIPDSIEGKTIVEIGDSTFANQTKITQVLIPSRIENIGDRAFENCTNLTSVSAMDNLEHIGVRAFKDCSKLTELPTMNHLKNIGEGAFENCSSLQHIASMPKLETIGNAAFKNCTDLEVIAQMPQVLSISGEAFKNCKSLTVLSEMERLELIGAEAFAECFSLTTIKAMPNINWIGDAAFKNCIALTNLPKMDNIEYIYKEAFMNCSALQSIPAMPKLQEIEYSAFVNCSALTNLLAMDCLESLGASAFENCSSLEYVTSMPNLETIGAAAFKNCKSLINLPEMDNVKYIYKEAFMNCSELVTIPSLENVQEIGNEAFINCGKLKTNLVLDHILSIGDKAFLGCVSIPSVSLSKDLNTVGSEVFRYCTELNITVNENNKDFRAVDNVLYHGSIVIAAGNTSHAIELPESITEINAYAFENNSKLNIIRFKSSPTIGEQAFANCINLSEVYFDDVTMPTLQENAFLNDSISLFVPYINRIKYRIKFAEYDVSIDSLLLQVMFMDQGKIVQKEEVYYGSNVYFPRLKMKDHAFFGWFQKDGNAPGFYNSKIWDTYEDIVLHAEWVYNSAEAYLDGIKQVGTYYVQNAYNSIDADGFSINELTEYFKTQNALLMGGRLRNDLKGLEGFENQYRPQIVMSGNVGTSIREELEFIAKNLSNKDIIYVAGKSTCTFLKSIGLDIGLGYVDNMLVDLARDILNKAEKVGCRLILPEVIITASKDMQTIKGIREIDEIPADEIPLTILPPSYIDKIGQAQTLEIFGYPILCSTEDLLEADSEVIETLNNTIKTTVLENERLANEKNTSLIFLHDTEGYGRTQIYKYYSQEMRRPPYDAPMYSIYIKNGQYSDRKTVYDVNLQKGDIIFMRVEFDIRNTGNISDSQLSMERFKTLYNVFLPEVKYVLDQGGKVVLMASNPIDIHNESDFEAKEYNNPKFLQMSSDILQRNVGFIPIENIRQIVNSENQVVWTNNTYFYELD